MENNGEAVEHIAVLAKTLAEQVSLPPDAIMVTEPPVLLRPAIPATAAL